MSASQLFNIFNCSIIPSPSLKPLSRTVTRAVLRQCVDKTTTPWRIVAYCPATYENTDYSATTLVSSAICDEDYNSTLPEPLSRRSADASLLPAAAARVSLSSTSFQPSAAAICADSVSALAPPA